MIGGILVLIACTVIALLLIDSLQRQFKFINGRLLRLLLVYHFALAFVYYLYALFNPSDSKYYYLKVMTNYRGDSWMSFYGTSTTFIEFVGYPFIRFFAFSYEGIMVLFAFMGFIGFLYFYVFFRENIHFKHRFLGFDLVTLVFFLPNLHFWSSSFGKGSIIFMGIALYFFGISRLKERWLFILIGALITYHVRPHIMLVILVSSMIGFIFSSKGVTLAMKAGFVLVAGIAFFFIYEDVLSMVGISEDEFLTQGLDLAHRASELTKATSGVDITGYSLPMQLFTFLYRPLFFDAPGLLGLVVSVENLFYLVITFRLIVDLKGWKFMLTGSFLVKTAIMSFLTVSIALAQISGNLGLAIRQKSQVMILLMFVILAYIDAKKMQRLRIIQRRRAIAQQKHPLSKLQLN